MFVIEEELKKLPKEPGVYIMRDDKDVILYVGKAINLHNRVRSYFRENIGRGPAIDKMVTLISRFEYIVPGENDSPEDMEAQAEWIAGLRPSIPLHITRFFPRYHMMDKDATDVEQLYRLAGIAGKYLEKVYVGIKQRL